MNNIITKRNNQALIVVLTFFTGIFIICTGCNFRNAGVVPGEAPIFMPMELEISQAFSGIVPQKDSSNYKINVYVRILDQFGDSLKLPGRFRVELYQKIPNSNENNLGERLNINENGYIEFNLSEPVINQKYWDRISSSYALNFTISNAPTEITALVTWFYTEKYRLTRTIDLKITERP